MSLDDQGADVETAPPEPRRGLSLWFLAIPIALTLAAAAVAFFLLGPKDDDLLTTADADSVAVAVANASPAPPAFEPVQPDAQPVPVAPNAAEPAG